MKSVTALAVLLGTSSGACAQIIYSANPVDAEARVATQKAQKPRPGARFNDTGLTSCIVDEAMTQQCAGTDQDAALGRDARLNNPLDGDAGFKFTKMGPAGEALPADASVWDCVKDGVTGLIWEVKTNDGGWRDADNMVTNIGDGRVNDTSSFMAAVNTAKLCGYSDWRLPTRLELQSIAHYGVAAPSAMVDTAWLGYTRGSVYPGGAGLWTSTRHPTAWSAAWTVSLDNGLSYPNTSDQSSAPVRLVRGGAPIPASRFVPDRAEVKDTLTGLIWQRCLLGQIWTGSGCYGTPYSLNWKTALDVGKMVAEGTGQPWRLPNIKELNALVNDARSSPAMDTVAFPGATTHWLWSSTYSGRMANHAWIVNFSDGASGTMERSSAGWSNAGVRLVRTAP